ncbi:shikimate kinase [Rubrimonas cliftonensis]|uniref:Shikimate kinase n=1 Tax=Rubrimonas cliftonensis TaxID=89524 RepID=A0A1H4BV74_9RHOB|nr:shikimate kinase [Rubrimonas cliftonensis]SEA52056.1 shikimate kinase [Rubrimonas cliftonensis]
MAEDAASRSPQTHAALGARRRLRRTVVLIGLMGAGKSSVGRRLAETLDAAFHDSDDEIAAAAGMDIPSIFGELGEAAFRDGERRVIARLLDGPPHVLATGGGAFMNAQTRALIARSAVSVWIRADLDTLVERTGRKNDRPLLRAGDPREILARLMSERHPAYASADLTVESASDAPHDAVVAQIVAALDAAGALE